MTGDIYIFFLFGNGLIDDVIVIGWTDSDFKISRALVVTVMGKQCWNQAVLESDSLGHSVLQTPALVCFFFVVFFFYFYSSDHLVQWSRIILAILVKEHKSNNSLKLFCPEITFCWEEMSFKDFFSSIFRSGSHLIQQTGFISVILIEGHESNISVELIWIWPLA